MAEATMQRGRYSRQVLADIPELTRTNMYLGHSDYTVPAMMHEIARQVPDHLAIECEDDRITFAELESRVRKGAVGHIEIVTVISRDPNPPPAEYIEPPPAAR